MSPHSAYLTYLFDENNKLFFPVCNYMQQSFARCPFFLFLFCLALDRETGTSTRFASFDSRHFVLLLFCAFLLVCTLHHATQLFHTKYENVRARHVICSAPVEWDAIIIFPRNFAHSFEQWTSVLTCSISLQWNWNHKNRTSAFESSQSPSRCYVLCIGVHQSCRR